MLQRVLSLLLLGASLLLAGLPAVACAPVTPSENCCPSGPGQPCRGQAPRIVGFAPASGACCVVGDRATSSIAMSAKADGQSQLGGDPPALPAPAILATRFTRSDDAVAVDSSYFRTSGSALYLSTGRLRL